MGNYLRHLRGPEIPLRCKVETAVVIEVGDMVYSYVSASVRYVKPAGDFTWDTDLPTTQVGFKLVFMGVAKAASAAGEVDDILVDVSPHGQFRFDCASAKFTQGDMIAPAKAAGNALEPQKVVACFGGTASIFRVAEDFQTANVTIVNVTNMASHLLDDLSDAASGDT